MTDASGPRERRRTLLYLLVFAGTAALLAGLVELFALGQLGPGPYFNVALGSSVLLVSVLFLVPSPAYSALSSGPGTGLDDLPDPLTGRAPLMGVTDPPEPSARLPPGAGPARARPPPASDFSGTLAKGETEPAPQRPWQVRPLPTDLGGGFILPRNPEGVLETLDQLAEELTRPIPGTPPREPGDPGVEPSHSPPTSVDEEDLARPVVPARSPLPDEPFGSGLPATGNQPLKLLTEEELLHAIPTFVGPGQDVIPNSMKEGRRTPFEERSLQAGLEGFRRALPIPPGPPPRRPGSPSTRRGRGPSAYRTHSPSPGTGKAPQPDPFGPTDPHISEEDLQGMLSALEQRLRSGIPPSTGPSTPGNRRPWDPSPD